MWRFCPWGPVMGDVGFVSWPDASTSAELSHHGSTCLFRMWRSGSTTYSRPVGWDEHALIVRSVLWNPLAKQYVTYFGWHLPVTIQYSMVRLLNPQVLTRVVVRILVLSDGYMNGSRLCTAAVACITLITNGTTLLLLLSNGGPKSLTEMWTPRHENVMHHTRAPFRPYYSIPVVRGHTDMQLLSCRWVGFRYLTPVQLKRSSEEYLGKLRDKWRCPKCRKLCFKSMYGVIVVLRGRFWGKAWYERWRCALAAKKQGVTFRHGWQITSEGQLIDWCKKYWAPWPSSPWKASPNH